MDSPGPLRAADRPFGNGAITARPVAVVAVVDVRNPVEPRLNPLPDLCLPTSRSPPGAGPRGMSRTQSSVKKRHDRVDIMRVERVQKRLQRRRHSRTGHSVTARREARASRTRRGSASRVALPLRTAMKEVPPSGSDRRQAPRTSRAGTGLEPARSTTTDRKASRSSAAGSDSPPVTPTVVSAGTDHVASTGCQSRTPESVARMATAWTRLVSRVEGATSLRPRILDPRRLRADPGRRPHPVPQLVHAPCTAVATCRSRRARMSPPTAGSSTASRCSAIRGNVAAIRSPLTAAALSTPGSAAAVGRPVSGFGSRPPRSDRRQVTRAPALCRRSVSRHGGYQPGYQTE
jgi:hypothetical protein